VLGDIVKVTPTSKVVGDLALFSVSGAIDWDEMEQHPEGFDLPESVLGFLRGELGEPVGGLPQPFATRALRHGDAGSASASRTELALLEGLDTPGRPRRAALSALMFRDRSGTSSRAGRATATSRCCRRRPCCMG
jgi:pyruvate carboxylase